MCAPPSKFLTKERNINLPDPTFPHPSKKILSAVSDYAYFLNAWFLTRNLIYFNIIPLWLIRDYFVTKAKLLLLKLIHLFAREVLLVKKLEIEETKTS